MLVGFNAALKRREIKASMAFALVRNWLRLLCACLGSMTV
jgi:hypothetical protein